MRARRSCSHTDVRSAPNRRFAPMQNISSPADSVVDETPRENACSSSRSSDCRSVSPLACARSSASVKACPTEAASRICCGEGSFSQPMISTPIGSASAPVGRAGPAACRDTRARRGQPARYRRRTAVSRRGTAPRESVGPARDREAGDRRRRQRWPEGVAAAGELKNDGASALDGGHGMVMKHREQVAQPVRGCEGLEQAGLA